MGEFQELLRLASYQYFNNILFCWHFIWCWFTRNKTENFSWVFRKKTHHAIFWLNTILLYICHILSDCLILPLFPSLVSTYLKQNNVYCLKAQYQKSGIYWRQVTGEEKGTLTWKPVVIATPPKDRIYRFYSIKVPCLFKY